MTPEDQIKMFIGNQVFQMAIITSQLEEARKRIAELEEKATVTKESEGA